MNVIAEACLFLGYKVGVTEPILISRLKFASDTLLLGDKSWANFRALKAILILLRIALLPSADLTHAENTPELVNSCSAI